MSDFVNPVRQSGNFETLKSLKQKPEVAFRLSLGNRLEKLGVYHGAVCTAKSQTAVWGLQSLGLTVEKPRGCLKKILLGGPKDCAPQDSLITQGTSLGKIVPDHLVAFPLFVPDFRFQNPKSEI